MPTKQPKKKQQELPTNIYNYILPSAIHEIGLNLKTFDQAITEMCGATGTLLNIAVSDDGPANEAVDVTMGCLGGHEWVADNVDSILELDLVVRRYPTNRPSPVVIVNSYPNNLDISNRYHFTSDKGALFCSLLKKAGFLQRKIVQGSRKGHIFNQTIYVPIVRTYITSAIKCNIEAIPYYSPRQEYWSGYLFHEVRACSPKIVALFGKEAIWFFLRPLAKFGLVKYYDNDIYLKPSQINTQLVGRLLECRLPDREESFLVFCAGNPYTILKNLGGPQASLLSVHVHRFTELVKTVTASQTPQTEAVTDSKTAILALENDVEYTVIRSDERIDEFLHNIKEKQLRFDCVSLDCEWSGRNPYAPGARLRTVQFSLLLYKETNPNQKRIKTFIVCYTDESGNVLVSQEKLTELLRYILEGKLIFAHFGQTDTQWICALNDDLKNCFTVPDYWDFQDRALNLKGPLYLDTSVLAHTINENLSYDFNNLIQLFLNVPQYDAALKQYATADGYASVPDTVLLPYGAKDAFYTLQLGLKLLNTIISTNKDRINEITQTHFGRPHYTWPYVHDFLCLWSTMRCYPVLMEIMRNGLHLDIDKFLRLCEFYEATLQELLEAIRTEVNWPTFNPKSVAEVRALLFGREFYKLKNKDLPHDVLSLNLTPVFPTNSTFKEWSELDELERKAAQPSTSAEVLDILYTRYKEDERARKVIKLLMDYRTIDHVINNSAYSPMRDASGQYVKREGVYVFEQGYGSYLDYDGRVRSFFKPLNKTGRWASSPNLMNLPKEAEGRYKQILGDKYFCSLRNVFTVAQSGWVFLECDIKAAEMYVMAALSQDTELLNDLKKSELPPDHPDYRDIHSYNAVVAFQLDCPPTKEGLKAIGKAGLRQAAKRIIYGAAYGQTVEALFTMLSAEDSSLTLEEVQRVREAIFGRYHRLGAWLERAAHLGERGLTVINPFGRKRRFVSGGNNRSKITSYLASQFAREAKNFPIQSAVADLMNESLGWICDHRNECQTPFRIVNFVHDSILIEVPEDNVEELKQFLMRCFRENCIPIRDIQDGELLQSEPLYLSLDFSVSKEWQ